MTARLHAIRDLPSLGTELVTTRERTGSSTPRNDTLVRSCRYCSATLDRGLLTETSRLAAASPSKLMWPMTPAPSSTPIRSSSFFTLWSSRSAMKANAVPTSRPSRTARVMLTRVRGTNGSTGSDAGSMTLTVTGD